MHVITPCANLNNSIRYYQKLGYTQLEDEELTLFSDGKVLIQIHADRFIRPGICVSSDRPLPAKVKDHLIETAVGYACTDPNGVWIYFTDQLILEGDARPSLLGNFEGISLEVHRLESSVAFYNDIGFEVNSGSADAGWVSMKDANGTSISMMKPQTCPHLFFNPGLTYFNGGKNPEIIQALRNAGVKFAEEVTYFNPKGEVDNVILRDPGGLGIFVFND
ncbi:VOC family protein [bacterium]|nr:VOC family protein [bacterium]